VQGKQIHRRNSCTENTTCCCRRVFLGERPGWVDKHSTAGLAGISVQLWPGISVQRGFWWISGAARFVVHVATRGDRRRIVPRERRQLSPRARCSIAHYCGGARAEANSLHDRAPVVAARGRLHAQELPATSSGRCGAAKGKSGGQAGWFQVDLKRAARLTASRYEAELKRAAHWKHRKWAPKFSSRPPRNWPRPGVLWLLSVDATFLSPGGALEPPGPTILLRPTTAGRSPKLLLGRHRMSCRRRRHDHCCLPGKQTCSRFAPDQRAAPPDNVHLQPLNRLRQRSLRAPKAGGGSAPQQQG
jgi:hypothetical protein